MSERPATDLRLFMPLAGAAGSVMLLASSGTCRFLLPLFFFKEGVVVVDLGGVGAMLKPCEMFQAR